MTLSQQARSKDKQCALRTMFEEIGDGYVPGHMFEGASPNYRGVLVTTWTELRDAGLVKSMGGTNYAP